MRVVTICVTLFLSAALSVIQLKIQDGPAARQSNKLLLGVAWQYVRQGQKNCTFSWVEGRSLSSILNSEGDVYYEIHREKKSTKHSARQYPVEIQTRERFFLKVWSLTYRVSHIEMSESKWINNFVDFSLKAWWPQQPLWPQKCKCFRYWVVFLASATLTASFCGIDH